MKDFVFVVDDARQWHDENIKAHREHYSGVAWFGPGAVAWLQEEMGAAIYYNTHVRLLDEVKS